MGEAIPGSPIGYELVSSLGPEVSGSFRLHSITHNMTSHARIYGALRGYWILMASE